MLKAVYENQTDIPSEFAELYTEKNGKWELTGVEGIKTQADIDRLQVSLEKERNLHKDTKKRFSGLPDRPVEEIVNELQRIPVLEAAAEGKLDQTKIDEEVQRKINLQIAPVKRELDQTKQKLEEANGEVLKYKGEQVRNTIAGTVTAAARKANVVDTAIDDIVMYAERVFEVNEDGNVVTRDNVGVTPGVDATVWLSDMQPKRPHWFPGSTGGGAGGNGGGKGGFANNPFTHEHWNMTEQGQMVRTNPARAEQMAKAAGTTVGGSKPAARK